MSGVVTYLPKIFGGRAMARLEEDQAPADLPLQEWARRCQLAHADLEIEKAVLIEAQNQVVECQGRVMKAELLLERQQEEYRIAAAKLPGVPCLK
jgi:hypothetical protein